jgi:BMFP domain-containing protein YqiC
MPRAAKTEVATKTAAPKINVQAALKAAYGEFNKTTREAAKTQKLLARKDATIAKLEARVEALKAKLAGAKAPKAPKAVAPAVVKKTRKASADDADAPVAKRVKATTAPATKGKKAAVAVPAKKTKVKAVEAPAPKAKGKKAVAPAKKVKVATKTAKKAKEEDDFLL